MQISLRGHVSSVWSSPLFIAALLASTAKQTSLCLTSHTILMIGFLMMWLIYTFNYTEAESFDKEILILGCTIKIQHIRTHEKIAVIILK